jgi:hypothetical protein
MGEKKEIKDLEKIIEIQERTIAAERIVSDNIFKRWNGREQEITDWRYSYWKLERKFARALEEIRFLNHYIDQKEKKKAIEKKPNTKTINKRKNL